MTTWGIEMFKAGDRVVKHIGEYRAVGTVIGLGVTSAGKVLYMVEYDAIKGLVHIHTDKDLANTSPPDATITYAGSGSY